jgi:hypothetical protein
MEFILSQEQLIYTVSQLPSLETLILKNCIMKPGQYSFSICLPILSLNCLEIYLDTDLSQIWSIEAFYIKLVTETDCEPRYCFLMVEYSDYRKIIDYTIIDNPSESAFAANIINHEYAAYFLRNKSFYCEEFQSSTKYY